MNPKCIMLNGCSLTPTPKSKYYDDSIWVAQVGCQGITKGTEETFEGHGHVYYLRLQKCYNVSNYTF